jgi:DNA-binding response OmpR family regulator
MNALSTSAFLADPEPMIEVRLRDGTADMLRREIRFHDGQIHPLTPMEADLLRFLALHGGRLVSRAELLKHVWRLDPARVMTRTVDIHIGKLRRRLRDDLRNPRLLISIRGFGYMFTSPLDGS